MGRGGEGAVGASRLPGSTLHGGDLVQASVGGLILPGKNGHRVGPETSFRPEEVSYEGDATAVQ